MKYEFTKKMGQISGFGGDYEECCHKMVIAGMEWLDKHKKANPTFDQFKNVYGLTTNKNEDMKNMQKIMNESINNEASGAMMQACTNHILFANKNGWDEYVKEMEEEEVI